MVRPWLLLPAQLAHDVTPLFLKLHGRLTPFQGLTWSPFQWRNLEFRNPLGLAGGVDKSGDCIEEWWTFGPGFIEVGTVTPEQQGPLAGQILKRDRQHQAVWNRMGFPSKGADYVVRRLQKLSSPRFTPIFANIGKNRQTPLTEAHIDYMTCIKKLSGLVDAFVINISSPNTEGLRQLLKPENLGKFLQPILQVNRECVTGAAPTPILLKLSPDIEPSMLNEILEITLELSLDGWVLTNTTLDRPTSIRFPHEGGLSGSPLAHKSKAFLKQAVDYLGPRRKDKLIISVGGVLTASDVYERLQMGADLVQTYTALIFNGPYFFRQVARHSSASKVDFYSKKL